MVVEVKEQILESSNTFLLPHFWGMNVFISSTQLLITYYACKRFKDPDTQLCDDEVVQHGFEGTLDEHKYIPQDVKVVEVKEQIWESLNTFLLPHFLETNVFLSSTQLLITYYTRKQFTDPDIQLCDDEVVQHGFEGTLDEHKICAS